MDESTSLEKVLFAMRANKSGCVVTTNNGNITGIFTERDFLTKIANQSISWNQAIVEFATKNPITMKSNDALEDAIRLMKEKDFRHLPIFDDENNLQGVLSIRQLIQLFAEHFPADMMNLPPRLNKTFTTPEGG